MGRRVTLTSVRPWKYVSFIVPVNLVGMIRSLSDQRTKEMYLVVVLHHDWDSDDIHACIEQSLGASQPLPLELVR